MQYHDDVVDWEDDHARGRAWAVELARSALSGRRGGASRTVREMVLESGVLSRMLERSRRHFRAARKRSEVLGARGLSAWAKSKEQHAAMLAAHERQNAGYALRMHALTPWVAKVLS